MKAKNRGKNDQNKYILEVLDRGANTGEGLARIYYELIMFLQKEGEEISEWQITIDGIEKEEDIVVEARKRLNGESPYVILLDKGLSYRDQDRKALSYAQAMIDTINEYRDDFRSNVRIHHGNITDPNALNDFQNADLVLLNYTLYYLEENEREDLIKYLDTWRNAWLVFRLYHNAGYAWIMSNLFRRIVSQHDVDGDFRTNDFIAQPIKLEPETIEADGLTAASPLAEVAASSPVEDGKIKSNIDFIRGHKDGLRTVYRLKLSEHEETLRARRSLKIKEKVLAHNAVKVAKVIALYSSLKNGSRYR